MLETLPVEFREAYATLFTSKPDDVMKKFILSELKRRLAEYRLIDKKMCSQYGMSFSDFKKTEDGRKKPPFIPDRRRLL